MAVRIDQLALAVDVDETFTIDDAAPRHHLEVITRRYGSGG
jgi:hypothetical protein